MADAKTVALLAEGVDRNRISAAMSSQERRVALLAEGVDRNRLGFRLSAGFRVALLAEGVDRNSGKALTHGMKKASPSSRRAWIEIMAVRPTA